jgi:hypothetical protein
MSKKQPTLKEVMTKNQEKKEVDEETFDIRLTNRRAIQTKENTTLTLLYLGIRHGNSEKSLPIKLATPPCVFADEPTDYGTGAFSRVLLSPNLWDPQGTTLFMEFMNVLEDMFTKIKTLGDRNGFNSNKWYTPLKMEDGVLNGIVVKVKKDEIKESLQNFKKGITRFLLAVNCIWYNDGKGGVSVELVDVNVQEEEDTATQTMEVEEEKKDSV